MSAVFEIPCRASSMVDFRGGMPKTKKQCCIRVSYLSALLDDFCEVLYKKFKCLLVEVFLSCSEMCIFCIL